MKEGSRFLWTLRGGAEVEGGTSTEGEQKKEEEGGFRSTGQRNAGGK